MAKRREKAEKTAWHNKPLTAESITNFLNDWEFHSKRIEKIYEHQYTYPFLNQDRELARELLEPEGYILEYHPAKAEMYCENSFVLRHEYEGRINTVYAAAIAKEQDILDS